MSEPIPILTTRTMLALAGIAAAIMIADAFVFGIGHVDTGTYVAQIESWRHFAFADASPWRAFKPLYGILGLVFGFLPPVAVLLFANAAFLVGLAFTSFLMLAGLGFSKSETWLGAFWILTAYPALGLGFAAGTDISGWFFCIATIAVALKAIERKSDRLFILVSLIGFLGATGKETGALGLVFAGAYLLLASPERGLRATVKSLAALSLPFLALEAALFAAIRLAGLPDFFSWVALNDHLYENVYTLKFFFGAEFATFNALWLPIAIGVYALIARRIIINRERVLQMIALAIAALPVLEWHTFTDRILYIQCIVFVPVALCGVRYVFRRCPRLSACRSLRIALYAVPLAASAAMIAIGGHDGLYAAAHHVFRW